MIAASFRSPGQLLRVADGVHDPGVAAAAEHDQPAVAHASDQRLVVEDQRIGLPAVVAERLVPLEAGLELGRPVDLAGDQHRAVEEERWLALLDDLETGAFQRRAARRRELDRIEAREADPCAGSRTRDGSAPAGSPRPSARATPSIPVTWSQWPWLSTITSTSPSESPSRRTFSTIPVGETPVSNSSVRSRPFFSTRTRAEKPGSAMRASGTPSGSEPRRDARNGAGQRLRPADPRDRLLVGHQRIGDVVHQDRHPNAVDRLELDLLWHDRHPSAGRARAIAGASGRRGRPASARPSPTRRPIASRTAAARRGRGTRRACRSAGSCGRLRRPDGRTSPVTNIDAEEAVRRAGLVAVLGDPEPLPAPERLSSFLVSTPMFPSVTSFFERGRRRRLSSRLP